MNKTRYVTIILLTLFTQFANAQNSYYPPLSQTAYWDTLSPVSLGWCPNEIDSLYSFLEKENSKGFIVLKDGKIVLEKYFGSFTKDSLWYWASAGKTLTSFLVGCAQEKGFLTLDDSSSRYLGQGWTNCTSAKEGKIKISNQLTMTTGLDDGVPDNHCTLDTCLNFLAESGNRWAYHNAPYTLLEKVLTTSTGQPINTFTQSQLLSKTGMSGAWLTLGYDNVFFSKARSMARFGLLAQNKFIWNKDTLINDTAYIHQMTNTSQSHNLSYGYLWWLNGKSSFMVPTLQTAFPGSYAPDAPADMFAGIGKNGQIVSISKGKGLVMVRMGNAPDNFGEVSITFCNNLWKALNKVMCNTSSTETNPINSGKIAIFPNPADGGLNVEIPNYEIFTIEIFNPEGLLLFKAENEKHIDISMLVKGIYFIRIKTDTSESYHKFLKN